MPTNRSREWLIEYLKENATRPEQYGPLKDLYNYQLRDLAKAVRDGRIETYKLARKLGMPRKPPKSFLREEPDYFGNFVGATFVAIVAAAFVFFAWWTMP